MNLDELDRLLERYEIGETVVAVCGIVDAASGHEVDEGTLGIVREPIVNQTRGLVHVSWGGFSFVTSAAHLEPRNRPPNRGEKR